MLYFHSINFRHIKAIYQHSWAHRMIWFKLNLYVSIIWLTAIYAPPMIDAPQYVFIFFSTGGILGTLALLTQRATRNIALLVSTLGICTLLIYELYLALFIEATPRIILGTLLTVIGGIMSFLCATVSAEFMKKASLSATQSLSVRFYMTLLICLIMVAFSGPLPTLSYSDGTMILAITFVSLIIPLYLVQKAIENVGPVVNSIIISTTPLATALLESAYKQHLDWNDIERYALYSFFASIPFIYARVSARFR
jgi:hypothetical protein